jgi:hypothetical protein
MDNEELFDKIETYLIGQMTETERVAFEKQIATDDNLAMEVAFQRLDHDTMNVLKRNRLSLFHRLLSFLKRIQQLTIRKSFSYQVHLCVMLPQRVLFWASF